MEACGQGLGTFLALDDTATVPSTVSLAISCHQHYRDALPLPDLSRLLGIHEKQLVQTVGVPAAISVLTTRFKTAAVLGPK